MNSLVVNPRQQSFIQNVIEGMNFTDAYQKAYNQLKRTCASAGAGKLLRKPKVITILKQELDRKNEYVHQKQKELINTVGVSQKDLDTVERIRREGIRQSHSVIKNHGYDTSSFNDNFPSNSQRPGATFLR